MDFELSPEELETRNWAKAFAERVIAPHAEAHTKQKLNPALLKEISAEGFMTLLVPESLGGLGLTPVSFALVMQELARVCGSVAVSVAVTNMIADVLVREGTPEQQKKYLSLLTSQKSLTASFCLTENQAGSDASALRTTATKKGNEYEISGEKIYVTNGAWSEFFLVMARTSDAPGSKGVSAFLVDRNAKGLMIGGEEEKMGLEGSSTIRIALDHVKVPESARVQTEGEGFKIAMRALDGGRISVASQALGIARASLAAGVRYAKEREAFGKPIAEFQAIQWKIADGATALAAAEALILRAAYLKGQKKEFTREASMAKVFATESAMKVCDDMIQIHGGYGYIKEYPVERYFRDVRVTTLYEGTSEIQRMVIARDILKTGVR